MYHSYDVISATNIEALNKAVNAKLADGFVPIGGVEVSDGTGSMLQAVAKPLMMSAMLLNTVPVKEKKKKDKKKKKNAA
jgi:hypothetical protein